MQKVVAVHTEKIRRIETACGFTLSEWQQRFILRVNAPQYLDLLKWAHGNHDRLIALRRACALRFCLYQRTINGKALSGEILKDTNKINIHRLEDAEINAEPMLWSGAVEFKYYVKSFYEKLQGTGIPLKTIIF